MLSIRQIKRRRADKLSLLTTGGVNEYQLAPAELDYLVRLLRKASSSNLKGFLLALLTNRELSDLTRRAVIARALIIGKSYEEINKRMHTGKSTISIIHKALERGDQELRKTIRAFEGAKEFSVDNYWTDRFKKGK